MNCALLVFIGGHMRELILPQNTIHNSIQSKQALKWYINQMQSGAFNQADKILVVKNV